MHWAIDPSCLALSVPFFDLEYPKIYTFPATKGEFILPTEPTLRKIALENHAFQNNSLKTSTCIHVNSAQFAKFIPRSMKLGRHVYQPT